MQLDHPRSDSDTSNSEDAVREQDLTAELARILARPPRRAATLVHADGGVARPTVAALSRATTTAGTATADEAAQDAEPIEEETDLPPPAQPLPPWAQARPGRRLARNLRLVGASLVAVTVVGAIVVATAAALFGGPRDMQALKRMLLSDATPIDAIDPGRP